MLYVFVCMCVFSFKSILRNLFQLTLKIVILQIMKPICFFIRQLFVYFLYALLFTSQTLCQLCSQWLLFTERHDKYTYYSHIGAI
jgi:uncharacterized membrane protein